MFERSLPSSIHSLRDRALDFLASAAGERFRHTSAWLVVALPLIFRLPGLRKHWALRILEFAGGRAVLIRLGEAIRDWTPSTS